MGWKSRGNRYYYYETERHGGRVVSRYVGSGEAARIIAVLTEKRRAEARAERARERAKIEKMQADDAAFDQIDAAIRELTKAYLIDAGFHQVKRVWRRKRCSQN